jgi:hypothetical protein
LPPSVQQLQVWLRQVEHRPRFLLVGPNEQGCADKLTKFGCSRDSVTPGAFKFRDDVVTRVRRDAGPAVLGVLLLPRLRDDDRIFFSQSLTVVGARQVLRVAGQAVEADLLDLMNDAIALSAPKTSSRTAVAKDMRQTIPHHGTPPEANGVVATLCALKHVNQVRFWKASGSEYRAELVGEDVKVHLRQRYGLVINATSTHPTHLAKICEEIRNIIVGFK